MIRKWLGLCLFLFLVLPGFATAQTVQVTSGEHDGFTRLVFDYGHPVDWRVGRSEDGYVLRINDEKPIYNLSNTFNLIGKSRLAAIGQAADNDDIRISLACPCHVFPFEFRPGTIVVDLKDGPPPKSSAFEVALTDETRAGAGIRPQSRPERAGPSPPTAASQGYDWVSATLNIAAKNATPGESPALKADANAAPTETAKETPPSVLEPDLALQPLRQTLVENLARGASQGVVEMAQPIAPGDPANTTFPSAQIRIGEARTKVTSVQTSLNEALGSKGEICVDKALLEVETWGDATLPPMVQLADHRLGLTGEFDRPNPEAVAKLVRLYLYFGFGAEAREVTKVLGPDDNEARVWRSLGAILDGETDSDEAFKGQAACDGPAALWGLLGQDEVHAGDLVNEGAVRLAFSALPLHLRKLVGPNLAERFNAMGNHSAARALTDSITRAADETEAPVALMEADLSLLDGDSHAAEMRVQSLLEDPGRDHPNALIALVKARTAQRLPISNDVVVALEAFENDFQGTELETPLGEAVMLAQASSGDFANAFMALPRFPGQLNTLWELLSAQAGDDDFLAHAVLPEDEPPPRLTAETAASIARRLTGLGLGGAASRWLAGVEAPDPTLSAQIALQERDGLTALANLAGQEDAIASEMKLQAWDLMGEHALKAAALRNAGDAAGSALELAKAGDWESLAQGEEAPWKDLAKDAAAAQGPDAAALSGPSKEVTLDQARAVVQLGSDARAGIETLLGNFPAPKPPPLTGW